MIRTAKDGFTLEFPNGFKMHVNHDELSNCSFRHEKDGVVKSLSAEVCIEAPDFTPVTKQAFRQCFRRDRVEDSEGWVNATQIAELMNWTRNQS